jgi:hypothetical protein
MMNFRFIAPAVLIQTGSLFAYVPFLPMLRTNMPIPLHYSPAIGAICMALAFILLVHQAWRIGLMQRLFKWRSSN